MPAASSLRLPVLSALSGRKVNTRVGFVAEENGRTISAEALLRKVVGQTEARGTEGEVIDVGYSIRQTNNGPMLGVTYRLEGGETVEYVTDRYILVRQIGT